MQTKGARLAAACISLLVFAAGGCGRESKTSTNLRSSARAGAAQPSRSPLVEAREKLAFACRLAPDRRLIEAVGHVEALVAGKGGDRVSAQFTNGSWVVTSAGQQVGALPELPDFEDGQRLLVAWAARLIAGGPAPKDETGHEGDSYFSASSALRHVQSLWDADPPWGSAVHHFVFDYRAFDLLRSAAYLWKLGVERPKLVHFAAGATTSVALHLSDSMQAGDEVYAWAWALAAYDEALDQSSPALRAQRAQLAWALGYRAAAKRASADLPADDSMRAYLQEDDAALGRMAARASAAPLTRYLWWLRLQGARRDREADAYRWRWFGGDNLLLTFVMPRLEHGDSKTRKLLCPAAPAMVLLDAAYLFSEVTTAVSFLLDPLMGHDLPPEKVTANILRSQEVEPSRTVAAADAMVAEWDDLAKEPPAWARAVQQYYRASMYSALRALGMLNLEQSAQAARKFATELERDPGPSAARFRRWFECMIAARAGGKVEAELLGDIQRLEGFGGAVPMALVRELSARLDWASPTTLETARTIVARLDSRPSDRDAVAFVAQRALDDSILAGKMYRSAVAAAPGAFPEGEAWLARPAVDQNAVDATGAPPSR